MRDLFIEKFQKALKDLKECDIPQYDYLENCLESFKTGQRKLFQLRDIIYQKDLGESEELKIRMWAVETLQKLVKTLHNDLEEIKQFLENKNILGWNDPDNSIDDDNLRYSNRLLENKKALYESIMNQVSIEVKKALRGL